MSMTTAGEGKAAPAKPIPSRIKEAREARGFTLEAFADAIGVTKSAVAQYESGQTTPSGQAMSAIIAKTEQPPAFFIKPSDGVVTKSPFFRSLKRMQQHHRKRIERRLVWAYSITSYIERFIDLPEANIPSIDFDYENADDQEIEEIADKLRDHWGLGRGPIDDLVGTMEINGVCMVEEHVNCDDMDAVSCWIDGRPFVLMSKDDKLGPRKNFNIAHELGHLILHALVELDSKNLDRVEKQANRFASAFLMPQESFGSEIIGTSLNYLMSLKLRWNVAISAMGYRAKDLGLLSKDQFGYLLRQMNAKKIRKHEPYDEDIFVSEPSMISHSIEMLLDHGVQTRQQIMDSIPLNPQDIESLCGLPAGFLDKKVVDISSALRLRI